MKFAKYTIPFILMFLTIPALFFGYGGKSSPAFYLGTDKTFTLNENAYINLEGPENRDYTFRVYKVKNPADFFVKGISDRLVEQQGKDKGYADFFAILSQATSDFKKDFRELARKEFNSDTRSSLKEAVNADLDTKTVIPPKAIPAFVDNAEMLFTFSVQASKPDENKESTWAYRKIPLPVKEKGVYLIECFSAKNTAYTVVIRSDYGFVSKQYDSGSMIFAADMVTGEPLDGASVSLYDFATMKKSSSSKTSNGICSFSSKPSSKSFIVLEKNGQFAVSDPDFFSKSFYGEGGVRAYIYTDRPVYRPGDEVQFKGVVRNFSSSYKTVSGKAKANVYTEKGESVKENIPVEINSDTGTFNSKFTLPSGEPYLGTYNIVLEFEDKTYSSEFSVDAYKKPTYLVKVETQKKFYPANSSVPLKITAKFYYGSPVAGAQCTYKVFRKKKFDYSPVGALPFFADAADYLGINMNGNNELVSSESVKLNDQGEAVASVKIPSLDDDYSYTVLADVTDNDLTYSGSASFSANRSDCFVKIFKDKNLYEPGASAEFKAKLVPYDKTNEAVIKSLAGRQITFALYSRSFYNISTEGERKLISESSAVTDSEGNAVFSFKASNAGHYVAVISAKDGKGQVTETETPFWVSGKGQAIEVPFKNITLKSSKDIYAPGDKAEILIMTPASGGHLLVCVEGDNLISKEIIKMNGNSHKYYVKITDDMTPNFTLNVVQFSAGNIYTSQLRVNAPPVDKFLDVAVKPVKTEYIPGTEAEVEISTLDYKGKGVSAEVSVGVVDEAIYQIREEDRPNISTFFYHPRTNNVSTVFSSNYRLFGYAVEKNLKLALNSKNNPPLAVLKEDDERARDRFKDTTFWSAKVKTNAEGKAVVKIPLADNVTTWRVTAIAVTKDTKVGQGIGKFLARKKLMITPAIPAYILTGEEQQIGLSIANLTESDREIEVEADADGAEITGTKKRKFQIKAGRTAGIYYTVKAPENSLKDSFIFSVKAESPGSSDIIKVPVRLKTFGLKADQPISLTMPEGDASQNGKYSIPSKFSGGTLSLYISAGVEDSLMQALDYLAGYPYGCVEQTMSRFMPLLAAKQAGYIPSHISGDLDRMTSDGMKRIESFQKPDGGFSWYGEGSSDAMMSAYILFGLSVAKKNGLTVNPDMADKTVNKLSEYLSKPSLPLFERGYILFALEEWRSKNYKSVVSFYASLAAKGTIYEKAIAASLLYSEGNSQNADKFFDSVFKELQASSKKGFNHGTEWKDDEVEAASILLLCASRVKNKSTQAEALAEMLAENRIGNAWKNSRDTAMAVIALSEYSKQKRIKGGASGISVFLNGKQVHSFPIRPSEIGSNRIIKKEVSFKAGTNLLEIKKSGGGKLMISANAAYTDKSSSFSAYSRGISILRKYKLAQKDVKNQAGISSFGAQTSFSVGDLVEVELTITPDAPANYLLADDVLPAGFSYVKNDQLFFTDLLQKGYTERQMYDDHAVFFMRYGLNSTSVRYFIRAEIPGFYKVIPAGISHMYNPNIKGYSSDSILEIRK